jgi:hypothetical protein
MSDRFSGEIGQRLCIECDSILVENEGDGAIMRRDHCAACSESCDCPDDRPLAPNSPLNQPEYRKPGWMRSGRHG